MQKSTAFHTRETEQSYRDMPYISKAFHNSMPFRQQTMMALFGLDTPELAGARVLEIGCSFGGNSIAVALSNPDTEVVGVDLSPVQIEEGNRLIEAFGLKNIRLLQQNVLELDASLGKFDYIICHGVFSWVNGEVQDAILRVIRDHLSENGSAFVSYNTYPGWKNLDVLRDIMMFRTDCLAHQGIEKSAYEKLILACETVGLLAKEGRSNEKIRAAAAGFAHKEPHYLMHEFLEPENRPLYLREFAAKLEKYGLMHVVDAELVKSFPNAGNSALAQRLAEESGGDRILLEQYWDFLNDQQFRSSLITHSSNRNRFDLSGNLGTGTFERLHFRGVFAKDNEGTYRDIAGNVVRVDTPDEALMLEVFNEHYPQTLTIGTLKESLAAKSYDAGRLYSDLMSLIYSQNIDVYSYPLQFAKQEKLQLSDRYRKYLTYFAETKQPVIHFANFNARLNYQFSSAQLSCLLMFDGTRSDEDMVNELFAQYQAGLLNVSGENEAEVKGALTRFVADNRRFVENNFMNR